MVGILFSTKRHMPTLAARFARVAADNTGWSTVLNTAKSKLRPCWGPCWHLEMPLKSLCYEVLVIYIVIWHFDTVCGVPDSIVLTFVLNRSILLQGSVIHFFRLRCFFTNKQRFFHPKCLPILGANPPETLRRSRPDEPGAKSQKGRGLSSSAHRPGLHGPQRAMRAMRAMRHASGGMGIAGASEGIPKDVVKRHHSTGFDHVWYIPV